jgi:hypothetical protein
MEAKVDIRKLQVLNDRINQTLEALNQVRLTVHGLGHSSPYNQGFGQGFGQNIGQNVGSFGGQPFGSPYGQQGFTGSPFGYGANPYSQGMPGMGLQHSPFQNPYVNPFVNPLTQLSQQGFGQQGFGQQGMNVGSPWTQQPGNVGAQTGGLFHSDPIEMRANDPTRIVATFPNAMSPLNPVQNWLQGSIW